MFKKVAVMAFSLTTLLASTCLAVMTGPFRTVKHLSAASP